jgi:Ca-activated chloride channel family protein
VTVTDSAGGYVKGLTEGDFIVLENGVPQPLAFFRPGPCRSMSPSCWTPAAAWPGPLPVVKAAAKGLVATLKEGDRAAVLSANRSVQIPQTFTTDRHAIDAAIDGVSARGPTAVYDALYIALKELARHRRAGTEVRRQVLIMLSDGLDNASHVSADDVAEAARRVSASVYAIALIAPDQVHVALPGGRALARAAFEMQALARDSGGRIFRPTSSLELPRIYGSIANELANQYDLAYEPGGANDGRFRRLAVRLSPETRASARTRSGYYASR